MKIKRAQRGFTLIEVMIALTVFVAIAATISETASQSVGSLLHLQDKTLDAAIRFGTPPWAGHDAQLICPAYAVPVASSKYVQQNKEKDKNWQQHSLIHGRNGFDDWQAFGGVSGNPPLYFDSSDAGLCAARAGLGVALGIRA